jgi:hypothetical protein
LQLKKEGCWISLADLFFARWLFSKPATALKNCVDFIITLSLHGYYLFAVHIAETEPSGFSDDTSGFLQIVSS